MGNHNSQPRLVCLIYTVGQKAMGILVFLTGGARLEAVFFFFPTELKPGTEVDCGSRVPLVSTGKYSVTIVVRSRRLMSSRERLV